MFTRIIKTILIILTLQLSWVAIVHAATTPTYRGVNLSGAEFAGCTKPAAYGTKYIYPNAQIFDTFIALGMNTFRLPFCWERLQPTANGPLDSAELGRLDTAVRYATGKGAYVVLDPHNYATYWGKPLVSDSDNASFADFWQKLAAQYKNNDHVIFGLMNEPHGISSESWVKTANTAIAAIRQQQANNLILVPGTAWTGAHSWLGGSYGTANAVSLLNVQDSANNYAYDMHQYLDTDSSGTHTDCVNADIGAKRLLNATQWLQQNNRRGFLGEFGAANNSVCIDALNNLLASLAQNSNVWIGWTYWSAGAWLGNYMYALPLKDTSPQLDVLKKYLSTAACSKDNPCAPVNPPTNLKSEPR